MPVKAKVITAIALLLAFGFLATTLASYYVSSKAIKEAILQDELPLTSDSIYSEIQRDLLRPIFVSSLMASNTFLRDWVLEGEKDTDKITRFLSEIKKRYNAFTSFLVSENTHTYYQAKGILKKVREDEPRDNWYFRVRDMDRPYETNVDPDMANNDTITIFINYRVLDYQGNFIGATGIGLRAHAVKSLIGTYQSKYGRQVYFTNKQGIIQLHSGTFDGTELNIHKRTGISKITGQILSQKESVFEYDNGRETILLQSRFIPELQWYLLVEVSTDQAFRTIRGTLITNLIICTVVFIVVLLIAGYTINQYQSRLEEMTSTDSLTGAVSRQTFELIINQIISHLKRDNKPMSVIFFDIDDFKGVNDRYGHAVGDRVLKEVVKATRGRLRESDILCRWGGEEFLILLEDCNDTDAAAIAENIRSATAAATVDSKDGPLSVSISLGIAQHRADENQESLILRADKAMYTAKEAGKNTLSVAS